jgi:hypothetical protein
MSEHIDRAVVAVAAAIVGWLFDPCTERDRAFARVRAAALGL